MAVLKIWYYIALLKLYLIKYKKLDTWEYFLILFSIIIIIIIIIYSFRLSWRNSPSRSGQRWGRVSGPHLSHQTLLSSTWDSWPDRPTKGIVSSRHRFFSQRGIVIWLALINCYCTHSTMVSLMQVRCWCTGGLNSSFWTVCFFFFKKLISLFLLFVVQDNENRNTFYHFSVIYFVL